MADKQAEKEKTVGIECRKCGCRHFYVDHTEAMPGKIVRYRRCRNCGNRIVTTERVGG